MRPSVGRMSASAPVTTCERLSLVDTCTVRSVPRMAASAAAVSEIAATRLPPSANQTLISPRCIASIDCTESSPCRRGGSNENSVPRASRKLSGIRSQMPIVRSPCTLLCPRMGEAPAPGLPMFPRSSRRLMISLMVSTPLRCCVRPIAQVMITRSAAR